MSDTDLTLLTDTDDPEQDWYTVGSDRLYDEAEGPRRMTRFRTPGEWSDAP